MDEHLSLILKELQDQKVPNKKFSQKKKVQKGQKPPYIAVQPTINS